MRSMQAKIMEEIDSQAKDLGVDLIINKQYANTGTLLWQHEWDTLLQVSYSFQRDYATFKIPSHGNGYRPRNVSEFGRQGNALVHYADRDEILALFADIMRVVLAEFQELT